MGALRVFFVGFGAHGDPIILVSTYDKELSMSSMPVPCSSHDAISGAIYPDDVSGVAVAELQP